MKSSAKLVDWNPKYQVLQIDEKVVGVAQPFLDAVVVHQNGHQCNLYLVPRACC